MLCVGSSVGVIIGGRILQGISAAVVWTVGLALLVDTVGQQQAGQAMGYISLAFSLGVLGGPLLGGVVFAKAGYFAVFGMAFGLIGLDITLRLVLIEKKATRRWIEADEMPSDYGIPATNNDDMESASHRLDSLPNRGNSATHENRTIDALTDSHESPRPHQNKLPPVITLLGSRRLLAGLWACLVQATLLTSFDAILPLFVRNTFGWTSTGAGLIFLAIVAPTFLSPISGYLSDRYGPRWIVFAGFLFATPFLILLRYVTHDSLNQKVLLCALLFLIGFGITLVFAPITAEITYVVEAKERKQPGLFGANGATAQAYGLFNVAWAGGCLIGPLWAGMVNETAGWNTMAWTLGLLSFVTAFPTAIWTGGLISRPARQKQAAAASAASPSPR
ncbi:MAG: hypothetical protein M1822_008070 [Bathelium mastoideum]|nr:MAG: hypothetical protein M1822_008070 [Bathelium mastoideum]